ncbi:MAG: IgGFc-binding protein [Thaumarchaeota archaeon]|nr:IgGFc-binding protein [Nitrososphaerota archaeon]
MKMDGAVSPLLATLVLAAVTVAGALLVYMLFTSSIGTLGSIRTFQVSDVDVVKSSIGVHLRLTLRNTGNARIVGLRVLVDGVDVTGRFFGSNVGTEFYGIMLDYFEIVASEDDTHVKVEQLNEQGQVVATVENTISSKGGRWRYDGSDLKVYRVTSDKPVAVFTSSIQPSHGSADDFYSLAGTDLWLYIPAGAGRKGAVFITAYQDNTVVTITDYGNGDDTQEFTLDKGEFWEQPGIAEENGGSKGEVWHVQASKPITVMAGYPDNDEYEEVKSPDGMEYYFPLIGNDPYIYVIAKEDNTHVSINNLDGSSGDWTGTLNKGGIHSAYIPYARSGGGVEWVRVHVSADKPVCVLDVDPGAFGASWHSSSDNPANAGFNYVFYTGLGRYLSIIALTPAAVTVSGSYSWTDTFPAGGSVYLDLGGYYKNLIIDSTGILAVYTLAPAWGEGITVLPPILNVEPGESTSGFTVLPDDFETGEKHILTVEAYFEDGSKVTEVLTFTD